MAAPGKKKNTLLMVVVGLWIGVFLGGLVLVALALTGVIPSVLEPLASFGQPVAALQVNQPAPEFTTLNSSGQTVRLADLQGKFVVLNFWATWCGPCVREVPMFSRYQAQYPDFVMLGVNQGESQAEIDLFRQEVGMDYENLLDRDMKISALYEVVVLPTTFFIDGEGMVRYRHIGYMSEPQFEYYLQQLGVVK